MQKVLIAGGSGLVGSNLKTLLREAGYEVFILSRTNKNNDPHIITWDINKQVIDFKDLDPEIVINLTGAGIADKPWTNGRKKILIDSRVESTGLLEKYIADKIIDPKVFISASAVGIYGDRADEILDETSPAGDSNSFLVHCCELWESAAQKVGKLVHRSAIVRIGLVLSNQGGALEKIQTPVKLGGAAYFGDGKQYYPWIHIDDLSRIFLYIIQNDTMKGTVNGVGPNPVNMKDFMSILKNKIRSWALSFPVPAFVLRTAMGEMSSILLNSNRAVPTRLLDAGFVFNFETLGDAISDLQSNPSK